jgi:hypothetical protein
MSYEFYKIIHVTGIILLFASLGGFATFRVFATKESNRKAYKTLAMTHGISLLIVLVAGFGLIARTGIAEGGFPLWIYGKLGIWLLAGGIFTFIKKGPLPLFGNLTVVTLLGVLATVLAVLKF